MAYNFIECNREQMYLMPLSLQEWLPEDHLAWFIIDAVKQMDLLPFYKKYRTDGLGQAAYEPSMMVGLLLYAYCLGVRSSRRIERACEVDVAFKVITANQKPDYSTTCRFRQENERELERLFTEVLRMCSKAGMVKVGMVALDGTKVEANASLAANLTREHIEAEVKRMFEEAEAMDKAEDALYGKTRRGDELPEELRNRKSRLERLKKCKERLEREEEEKKKNQAEKIQKRLAEETMTGKKKRGRKPKEPESVPETNAKANITDPESRIMKTRKGYVQGYNAQTVVTKDQIIVAADVTQEENDVHQLYPMLDLAEAELKEIGIEGGIEVALMDAGYWSECNILQAASDGMELLIATKKDWKQREAMRKAPPPRGRIPNKLSVRERMERKLLTNRGKKLYKFRSQTVEPVFGQIKDVRGCKRFMRRGHYAVQSEWSLICATHNLLKLFRNGNAVWN